MSLSKEDKTERTEAIVELAKMGKVLSEDGEAGASIYLVGAMVASVLTELNETLEEIRDAIRGEKP